MKRFVSFTVLSLFVLGIFAASPDVTGKICDEKGEPMPFVNVVLLNAADSSFIQGTTTDSIGRFHIVCKAETGIIKASSIGYSTEYINVERQTSDIDELVIRMKEDSKVLAEVVVRSQLPKTRLTGNSMITSVQGTVLEKSGTAQEMLTKVPGLMLKDDKIEVIGKGQPIFYINGRKVQDLNELKRLHSDEIANVEVITNPGAMYDATVTAVVRIKTIRRQGNGFGFDASAGFSQDLGYGYSMPDGMLNLRYRHNNLDLFGMVNYWKGDYVNNQTISQHTYIGTVGNVKDMQQTGTLRSDPHYQGLESNLGFNYQISNDHSVGARIERHDKLKMGNDVWQETFIQEGPWTKELGGVYETSQHTQAYEKETDHIPYNWTGNAYYNGKVGKMGIDLNMDFLSAKETDDTDIDEETDGVKSKMQSTNPTSSSMVAGKLVLDYPIWKGKLSGGTEMSHVDRSSTYSFTRFNAATNGVVTIPNTDSKVKENNVAGFLEYACSIPKFGNLTAGLRYEHVGFDYRDLLDDNKSMTRYTDDLFPSISWSQQWGRWQASVGYSAKTNRPNYWQLSEAISYINPYMIQQGDPKLKNEKIKEVTATVRWSWIDFFIAYEQRDNALMQWPYVFEDNNNVIIMKNVNLSEPMRNLAMFLTASPTFGCYSPWWRIGWQQHYLTQNVPDPREASGYREVKHNRPVMFYDFNNTLRLKHNWQLELNASIMGKGDMQVYDFASTTYRINFVVQKCWLPNNALCLRAYINDIFKGADQRVKMDVGNYTLDQTNKINRHTVGVSLRYTFNASNNKYKGTGAGRAEADRLGK